MTLAADYTSTYEINSTTTELVPNWSIRQISYNCTTINQTEDREDIKNLFASSNVSNVCYVNNSYISSYTATTKKYGNQLKELKLLLENVLK